MTRSDDSGSVTVWVLCAGLVLVLVAAATALAGAAMAARHRAQATADLAALAGALLAWDGDAAACDRAAEVSARNGARLVACRLDGLDVVVTVEVTGAAQVGVARASARAGPVGLPSPAGLPAWVAGSGPRAVVRPAVARAAKARTIAESAL